MARCSTWTQLSAATDAPMPCYALVTNISNGKVAGVRVNDRVPIRQPPSWTSPTKALSCSTSRQLRARVRSNMSAGRR